MLYGCDLILMIAIYLSTCVCHWTIDFTKLSAPPNCVFAEWWLIEYRLPDYYYPPNYYDSHNYYDSQTMVPTIYMTHEIYFQKYGFAQLWTSRLHGLISCLQF